MNGRAYDPLFAQMLSPDPSTQFPGFSQGYERYSYCMNNPLKYTDPTGFSVNDEILVDEKTGKQQVISNKGGDDINFYYYGYYEKDGPDAGAFELDRTEVVDNTTKYAEYKPEPDNYGGATPIVAGEYSADRRDADQEMQDAVMGKGFLNGAIKVLHNINPLKGINDALTGYIYHKDTWTGEPVTNKQATASLGDGLAGLALFAVPGGEGAEGAVENIYTKSSFRKNLIKLTGNDPGELAQAHHVFPQQFITDFEKIGINIHEPQFGTWWETTSHLENAWEYNSQWGEFLETTNPTQESILQKGRTIMNSYGYNTNY